MHDPLVKRASVVQHVRWLARNTTFDTVKTRGRPIWATVVPLMKSRTTQHTADIMLS
jgi:hypothetical protein